MGLCDGICINEPGGFTCAADADAENLFRMLHQRGKFVWHQRGHQRGKFVWHQRGAPEGN